MVPRGIHTLTLIPDLEAGPDDQTTPGLVVIRLYDTGQAAGHSTSPVPPLVVEVIRCEMAAATDILIHLLPGPT
jgi:hypothetical protein